MLIQPRVPRQINECLSGSNPADIGQALLRQLHAVGDMARLLAIDVERKHRPCVALLGPADPKAPQRSRKPADRQLRLL